MFWTEDIIKKIGQRKIDNIATAISPSGYIHLGNLREVIVADTIKIALSNHGQKPQLIYIADDFDPLRKLYPFLPKEYEEHIGKPLSKIPDPFGSCHQSYSEHFLDEFINSLKKLGIDLKFLSATELYRSGAYTENISLALENRDKIASILSEISGREIESNWSPFNPLCSQCLKINRAKVLSFDTQKKTVDYECACGNNSKARYDKGDGKLAWRVDWAARWQFLNIGLEPMGKEHASSGGSYQTSARIAKEVFGYEPPFQVVYEFLYLRGSSGKMSSSLGNVITSKDILEIIPPELVRYLLIKNVNRHIDFDLGRGLLQLIDEYTILEQKVLNSQASQEEKELYQFTKVSKNQTKLNIPFRHLSFALQVNDFDIEKTVKFLAKTDHEIKDPELLKKESILIRNWLEKYAPEEEKFILQKEPPSLDINSKQKNFLEELLKRFQDCDWTGESIHKNIHEVKEELNLQPIQAFGIIYTIFLDRDRGPQAGWFLAGLNKDFVIAQIKKALKL